MIRLKSQQFYIQLFAALLFFGYPHVTLTVRCRVLVRSISAAVAPAVFANSSTGAQLKAVRVGNSALDYPKSLGTHSSRSTKALGSAVPGYLHQRWPVELEVWNVSGRHDSNAQELSYSYDARGASASHKNFIRTLWAANNFNCLSGDGNGGGIHIGGFQDAHRKQLLNTGANEKLSASKASINIPDEEGNIFKDAQKQSNGADRLQNRRPQHSNDLTGPRLTRQIEHPDHSKRARGSQPMQPRPVGVLRRQSSQIRRPVYDIQESRDLIMWLAKDETEFDGTVTKKLTDSIELHLSLPAAAHDILSTRGIIWKKTFFELDSLGCGKMTSGTLISDSEGTISEPDAAAAGKLWGEIQVGDSVRVRVHRSAANNIPDADVKRSPLQGRNPLKSPVVVIPVFRNNADSSRLPSDHCNITLSSLCKIPHSEVILRQLVTNQKSGEYLSALSPLSSEMYCPPHELLNFKNNYHQNSIRAPPSACPFLCRVRGTLRLQKQTAVVLEVLEEDREWLSQVISSSSDEFNTPNVRGDAESDSFKGTAPLDVDEASSQDLDGNGGVSHDYISDVRVLKHLQRTTKNTALQEYLLLLQSMLRRRQLGPSLEKEALEQHWQLISKNTQLKYYVESQRNYGNVEQRCTATGAIVLMTVEDFLRFKKSYPGWDPTQPIRAFFSLIKPLPHTQVALAGHGRGTHRGRYSKITTVGDGYALWVSAFPPISMDVIYLLFSGLSAPEYSVHLRMYEKLQYLKLIEYQSQEIQWCDTLNHLNRQLQTHRRGDETQQPGAEDQVLEKQINETGEKRKSVGSSRNLADTLAALKQKYRGQQLSQRLPHRFRLPMSNPWWTEKNTLHREVRLSQILGPFFYRRLVRLREAISYESAECMYDEAILSTTTGEPFEDITEWVMDPTRTSELTDSFVRRYVSEAVNVIKRLQPRHYAEAVPRLLRPGRYTTELIKASIRTVPGMTSRTTNLLMQFAQVLQQVRINARYRKTQDNNCYASRSAMGTKSMPRKTLGRHMSASEKQHNDSPLHELLKRHAVLSLQAQSPQRAPTYAEYQQRETRRRSTKGMTRSSSTTSPLGEILHDIHDGNEPPLGYKESSTLNNAGTILANRIRRTEVGSSVTETEELVRMQVPIAAYPSASTVRERKFYNYREAEAQNMLQRKPRDPTLLDLAGGQGGTAEKELFVPFHCSQ